MRPVTGFRSAIHTQFTRFYADHDGGSVTVKLHGHDVVVAIPAAIKPDEPPPLSAMQEAIIEALKRSAGEPPITGDNLAEIAGYVGGGGAWRKAIADLLLRGYIENCRPGYRLRTEAMS